MPDTETFPEWEPMDSDPDGPFASENEDVPESGRSVAVAVPFEPFPIEALPEPLHTFCLTASQAIGCDPSFVALPTLSAVAAAIGNSRRVEIKAGWCEPSIVWTAIVGESGTQKSPALDAALEPLRRYQSERLREYEADLESYEQAQLRHERDLGAWKKSKSEDDPPRAPERPVAERILVGDVTSEAVALMLRDAPRGLLLARDELAGWIGAFDKYKGGSSDAAHWLEMHRGDTLIVDRKTGDPRTIHVPRASVGIAGGIQPGTLHRVLGEVHVENGLAARLLLAMPPRRARKWTEGHVPIEVSRQVERLFDQLLAMKLEVDEVGEPRPVLLPLTPEARDRFADFVNEHGEEQLELTGPLAAAWSKLEGYAGRLALVVQLVRCAAGDPTARPDDVDLKSVEAGITLVRWFGREARRVYQMLREDDEAREIRELVERVQRAGGEVSVRDLQRGPRRYRGNVEAAEAALQLLVNSGLGTWEARTQGPAGGRPTRVFVLQRKRGDTTCIRASSWLHDDGKASRSLRAGDGGDGDETPESRRCERVVSPSPRTELPEAGGDRRSVATGDETASNAPRGDRLTGRLNRIRE